MKRLWPALLCWRIFLLSGVGASPALPGLPFSYYSTDRTSSDQVDYVIEENLDVLFPAPLEIRYSKEYHLLGCRENQFTYTNERSLLPISEERLRRLLADVRRISLSKLFSQNQNRGLPSSDGEIELDGSKFQIDVPKEQAERARLNELLQTLLLELGQATLSRKTNLTVEGDLLPASPCRISTLLKVPREWNGKRVKLGGYYYHDMETSKLRTFMNDSPEHSLWIGRISTAGFPRPDYHKLPEDAFVIVEGVFRSEPGGMYSIFPGCLERVTRMTWTVAPAVSLGRGNLLQTLCLLLAVISWSILPVGRWMWAILPLFGALLIWGIWRFATYNPALGQEDLGVVYQWVSIVWPMGAAFCYAFRGALAWRRPQASLVE